MTTGNIRTITAVFLPAGLLFFWYNIYEGWDQLPEAVKIMGEKPADLIKPVVRIQK